VSTHAASIKQQSLANLSLFPINGCGLRRWFPCVVEVELLGDDIIVKVGVAVKTLKETNIHSSSDTEWSQETAKNTQTTVETLKHTLLSKH